MTNHIIKPHRDTLHGQFSPHLPPVLTVSSGEVVRWENTLDVVWGLGQHQVDTREKWPTQSRCSPRDDGPALHGPVAISGAEPGMTLEIQFLEIRPMNWGWTWSGNNPGFNVALNEALELPGDPFLMRWEIDPGAGIATSEFGDRCRIAPFLGTIGMSPGAPGWHSGWYPTRTGGNMDCKMLVTGSSLFLPIEAPGGLVSLGDGHARQGDGELCGSAIECRMERVELRFVLHPELNISTPRVRNEEGWATLGFGRELDDATAMAGRGMLEFLSEQRGISRRHAAALASVGADFRMTQLVNGVRGVHAVLPHGVFEV